MNHKNKAFTLIELMIAIALAAIFGSVVIGMVLLAQSLANSARLKSNSTAMIDQTIERIRSTYRNNFSVLSSMAGSTNENCFIYDQIMAPPFRSTSCNYNIQANFVGIKFLTTNSVVVTAYNNYLDRGNLIKNKSSTIISNLQ